MMMESILETNAGAVKTRYYIEIRSGSEQRQIGGHRTGDFEGSKPCRGHGELGAGLVWLCFTENLKYSIDRVARHGLTGKLMTAGPGAE